MQFHSFIILVFTICWTSKSALAIDCFQCNSNDDTHCSEMFNLAQLDVKPASCESIYEANYCIKATGMYEGTIGTRRFCSSRHHGNYCEYVKRPGDERYYRSCVYTCSRDGCNGGNSILASLISILTLLLSVLCFRYL